MAEHDDGETSHPLLEAGWRQGVLFDAEGASYEWNVPSSAGRLTPGPAREVRTQKAERLVLISHACDIKAADEKYVEALICRKHDPSDRILARWDQNSPRYFIVDPNAGYVADASHRLKIAKSALSSLHHYGVPMDELRLYRFVEWLTRRYYRPTVPDPVYQRFHVPVYAALRELARRQPDTFDKFNSATNDVRVILPEQTRPPFTIGIVYLTVPALSETQIEAIDKVHRIIAEAVDEDVHVQDRPVIIELDEVPFGVLRRTQPLIIEYPSWGDEDAAPPTWLIERRSG